MITCAICGRELQPGDLLCQHTELEIARFKRDGCACGEDHCGEVELLAAETEGASE